MKGLFYLATIIIFTLSSSANAEAIYNRLIWDNSPQFEATIGYTPTTNAEYYVTYGFSPNEQNWQSKSPHTSTTFDNTLKSEFVTLSSLPANSPVYYRVCSSSGCGERLWFKTAPTDNSPYTVIAGGDTRTGWTTRRKGNQLVAKIRPLFIMHGGDYTNANTASEMSEYLSDWQLTFSNDVIEGTAYKRIYPFIATHGNHEDRNYNTLCQVFGVDYNSDNHCDAKDTFGAFNISPLLRVYTLNSQFKNSGWSSYANSMNQWLSQDLSTNASSAKWRMAQYHKPMYPHYTGKSDNTILVSWWAQLFYNHGVNLVVESDTHINKITQALKPSGSGFTSTTTGGTVYVGEGSWGAPARSANDPKSWTIDFASIQQFKVISVTQEKLTVRTAQFSSGAETLTKSQRDLDPLMLPGSIQWWSASDIGDSLVLSKATNGLSIIDSGNGGPVDPPTSKEIAIGETKSGLAGSSSAEIHFSIPVPAGTKNLSISTSGGSGDVDLYVNPGQKASSTRYDCRPYKSGNAESCQYTTPTSDTYFVMLKGYSSFSSVTLKVTGEVDGNTGGGNGGGSGGGNGGGTCDVTGINVYPNWPQLDWQGNPSHASSGDKMVYQGSVYQAKYWTQTIPGSDNSWSTVCQ
ncbi:cellulose-binding domain-containing protein [Vibrio cionasavignyae]|uniref:cellulose-binding domain-containing protein n=1 Tax=Vibrio cionasavignyae TaxID=2910252 RepID=UPI003D0E2871